MSDSPLVPDALLDALNRAIAVKVRRVARTIVNDRTGRALSRDGRVMLDRRDATTGILQPPSGGTGHAGGAEPPLGNPAADGYVLSSTTAGVRSWVPQGGAATTRWEPLTNGDPDAPALIFADGDVVLVEVPL